MPLITSRLPTRADYLSSKDLLQAFQLLDDNHDGFISGREATEMFNVICGREVSVGTSEDVYSFTTFKEVVEVVSTCPSFKVNENLHKYIKDRSKAQSPDALSDANCKKLFDILDEDRSGSVDLMELFNMFKVLGIPLQYLMNEQSATGTVTARGLGKMLRDINDKHPKLHIGVSTMKYLGQSVAMGGKLDNSNHVHLSVVPTEEVAKKKALLVGINYVGSDNELGGCINDVKSQMKTLMEQFGFARGDIQLLTEDQGDSTKVPTADVIRRGFKWLFAGAKKGDMLFFQYSGHGSQMPDRTGKEPDGKNECICPHDCMTKPWPERIILDDELHNIFYEGVPDGVRCVQVFDCCHSATITDQLLTKELCAPGDEVRPRYLEPPPAVREELERLPPVNLHSVKPRGLPNYNKRTWTFSGCQDHQTSADARIDGVRQGAMTWAFTKALKDMKYRCSYDDLLEGTRSYLRGEYQQVPALSTSCPDNFKRWYMEAEP